MAEAAESTQDIWSSVLTQLSTDDRITPQLQGFISLVEPKGVMAGTLYLEVPNELTRGMLEQRIRLPLLSAISTRAPLTRSAASAVFNKSGSCEARRNTSWCSSAIVLILNNGCIG